MHYNLWVIAVLCLCALLLQAEKETAIRVLGLFLILFAVLFGLEYARILTFTGKEVRLLLLSVSALGWIAVFFLGKSKWVGFLSGIALTHLIVTIFFDLKILLR
jgi:hypothetical protein